MRKQTMIDKAARKREIAQKLSSNLLKKQSLENVREGEGNEEEKEENSKQDNPDNDPLEPTSPVFVEQS